MLLVAIFLSVFLTGLILWLSSWKYWHLPGLGTPIFGDLYYSIKNFTISYKAGIHILDSQHKKYGETTALRFGPFVFISTADPYVLEELAFHPNMTTKEPIIYQPLQGVYEGAFSSTKADKTWKLYKKIILSSLDKKNLEIYHNVFVRRSQELVEVFSKKTGEFDLLPWVMLMALDITFETNCGIAYHLLKDGQVELHMQLFQIADEYVGRALTLGILKVDQNYLKKFDHVYNFVRKSASDVIENFKNPKSDLGYVPISNKIAAGKELSVSSMIYPISELFFETQYTVGVCMSGALIHLAVNPYYQEMAWKEQKEIFGDSLAEPTYDELKYMVYLERVIKETFRITSAPVTGRRSDGQVKVGDLIIPANATVLYFWDRLKKNPKYWKTPDKFDPDNFHPEEVARRPKYAYFAFSAGPRGCPGSQYATNCAKVVLSTILRNFKLSSPLKPEDLTYHPALLAHLDVPHMVSIEPRHKSL